MKGLGWANREKRYLLRTCYVLGARYTNQQDLVPALQVILMAETDMETDFFKYMIQVMTQEYVWCLREHKGRASNCICITEGKFLKLSN